MKHETGPATGGRLITARRAEALTPEQRQVQNAKRQLARCTNELRGVTRQMLDTPAPKARLPQDAHIRRAAQLDSLAATKARALSAKYGGAVDVDTLRLVLCSAWRDPSAWDRLGDRPLRQLRQLQGTAGAVDGPGAPTGTQAERMHLAAVMQAFLAPHNLLNALTEVQQLPGTTLAVAPDGGVRAVDPQPMQNLPEPRRPAAAAANTARLKSLYTHDYNKLQKRVELDVSADWAAGATEHELRANRAANAPVGEAFLRWAEEAHVSPNFLAQWRFIVREQRADQPPEVFANRLMILAAGANTMIWSGVAETMALAFDKLAPQGADREHTVAVATQLWYREAIDEAQARQGAVRTQDGKAVGGLVKEMEAQLPTSVAIRTPMQLEPFIERFQPYVERALAQETDRTR